MEFELPAVTRELQGQLEAFMSDHILPAIPQWVRDVEEAGNFPPPWLEDLKREARSLGLWNLFLPALRDDEPGTRLSNLEYAPLAEIMGRVDWASEVFNCNAPDTGNMELLHMFADEAQRSRWLAPLLEGEIRSCFAMTEPGVASSDPTNLRTSIRREGEEYVINGHKWFITNASHPNCRICILMGITDPDGERHARHSMVLVPMDTPGVTVVRNIPVMHHHAPEGHCEMRFDDVRVPASNLLGDEGAGFRLAQARLGPGRIHHCMRSIGQCEVALQLMAERASEREAFGKKLHEHANVADWIAESRAEIEQARLLVLKTAWLIDQHGARTARNEISMIKYVVPPMQTRIMDRAIQVFGAAGLTPDTPLSFLWTWGRALRFADGPDEVHKRTVARREVRRVTENPAGDAYLTPPGRIAAAG
jgi:acyl-CoA dehydrogenase